MNRFSRLLQMVALLTVLSVVTSSQSQIVLQGAGATFPSPLYEKWFANVCTPGSERGHHL